MPKPKSKNALSWANAVKMWNMHKKIYDPTHVYAMPKKGTAEYDDAKHVQVNGTLPAHLHKKAPFPAAALEQLRKHEKESEARREIAKREKVIELIKAVTPAKAEPAPKIVVPPLPARLEKKEEARLEVEPVKLKATLQHLPPTGTTAYIDALIEIAKNKDNDAKTIKEANERLYFMQNITKGYGFHAHDVTGAQKIKKYANEKYTVPTEIVKEIKAKEKAHKKASDTLFKENAEKRRKMEEENKKLRENYDSTKYKKIWGKDDFDIKQYLASNNIGDVVDFTNGIASGLLSSSVPDRPEWVWGDRFWHDYDADLEMGTYKLGQPLTEDIKKILESAKKVTPAKAKVIAAILAEAKRRKEEKPEEARLEVEPAKTKLTPAKEKEIAEILEAYKEQKAKPKVVQTPQGKAKLLQALEDLGKELDALPEPEEKEEADPFTSRYFTVASRKPLHLRKSHLKVEDQGTIELKKELEKNRQILSTIKDPAERKKFISKAEKEQKDNGNILYDKLKELGAVPTDRNKISLRKIK
jgi:hypothetical protein